MSDDPIEPDRIIPPDLSPIFEVGRLYGAMALALRKGMQAFAAGIRAGSTNEPLTPGQLEARSIRRYQARVAEERRKGLAYVHSYAARVRRDLGLKP